MVMKAKYTLSVIIIIVVAANSFSQTPGWEWGRSGIGAEHDVSGEAATDASGNVYFTGYFLSDSITFGAITLHNTRTGYTDMFITKYDSTGKVIWAHNQGGRDNDRALSVATDSHGNVIVTGYFYSDTIVFGEFTLTSTDVVSDMFVVKYDNAGNVLWAKSEGSPGLEIPYHLVVDNSDNVIVTGRFSGNSIVFGHDTLIQQGSMDVFVLKYNEDGNVLWGRAAGGGSNDEAYSADVDISDNIYVAGYFNQHPTFGTFTLSTRGQADIFLAKYSPSGTVLWVKSAGGTGDDRANSVSTDALGNSYVAGFFNNDTLDIGTIHLMRESGDNSFIAKYNSEGDVLWTRALHGDSKANSVKNTHGNLYVCGSFSGDTLVYGSDSLFLQGSTDFYLLRCDALGNAAWIIKQTSGGESSEFAKSVVADPSGNIYLAGDFGSHEPLVFGSDILEPTDNSYDVFIARLGNKPTGIEDLKNENEMSVYPNPSYGKFVLKSNTSFKTLQIFNVAGKNIYELNKPVTNGQNEIILPSMPRGIYLIRLSDGEKLFTRKLVIVSY
jgi:hypothetical protein